MDGPPHEPKSAIITAVCGARYGPETMKGVPPAGPDVGGRVVPGLKKDGHDPGGPPSEAGSADERPAARL